MMSGLLLLAAQAVSPSMLARSDAAAEAYLACLFGAARAGHAQGLSPATFEAGLGSRCRAEKAAVRSVFISIGVARGQSGSAAAADAGALDVETRQGIVETYVKTMPGSF